MAMGVCNDGGVYILLWAFCIVVGIYNCGGHFYI
jgi:hypothetical protein